MNKCEQQVAEFQLNILGNAFKSAYSDENFEKRTITYLQEELDELKAAFKAKNTPEVADALIDSIYFSLGALYQLGVDFNGAFSEVHRANMAKKAGVKPERGLDGDAAKPSNWTAPNIIPYIK